MAKYLTQNVYEKNKTDFSANAGIDECSDDFNNQRAD